MIGRQKLLKAKHKFQKFTYDTFSLYQVQRREEARLLSKAMGFPGQWEEHRRFQFEYLKSNGLKADSHVLEYGCGPLTLGIPLISYLNKNCYTGVDIRSSVAAIAYQQISKADLAGKNPKIIVSEDFGYEELAGQNFDIIWSFSMLYHLTDDLVAHLFSLIPSLLSHEGSYWANINAEHEESQWLEFPFVKRPPEFYEGLARKNGLSIKNLGSLADNGFRLSGDEKKNFLLQFTRN